MVLRRRCLTNAGWSALLALAALGILASAASAKTIPGRYIVVLKDSVARPGAVARGHQRKYGLHASHVYRHALKGYAAKVLTR